MERKCSLEVQCSHDRHSQTAELLTVHLTNRLHANARLDAVLTSLAVDALVCAYLQAVHSGSTWLQQFATLTLRLSIHYCDVTGCRKLKSQLVPCSIRANCSCQFQPSRVRSTEWLLSSVCSRRADPVTVTLTVRLPANTAVCSIVDDCSGHWRTTAIGNDPAFSIKLQHVCWQESSMCSQMSQSWLATVDVDEEEG